MNFNFFMPVRVAGGDNCVNEYSALLRGCGESALIITGKTAAEKSGALADVCAALTKEGMRFTVFSEVGQNPLVSVCRRAGELARQVGAGLIIGIGGGSPLDAAKASAIFAANPGLTDEELFTCRFKAQPLPLICVGTTAGTGSEVTAVSVLTQDESGRKRSITHPACYARVAFADASYTETVPFGVTVSTAIDALAHAVEGFFSPQCSDVSAVFAETAVRLLWHQLLGFYRSPGVLPASEQRRQLYHASLYAGMVLNQTGTAFPHPMGYVLTEDYNIPHGRACGAFLPELVRRAAEFEKEKHSMFLSWINTDTEEFCRVTAALADVGSVKMEKQQIREYGKRWEKLKNFPRSPGGFDRGKAEALLESLFL